MCINHVFNQSKWCEKTIVSQSNKEISNKNNLGFFFLRILTKLITYTISKQDIFAGSKGRPNTGPELLGVTVFCVKVWDEKEELIKTDKPLHRLVNVISSSSNKKSVCAI